jgi:two-component system NtrC family sensor kinase
MVRIERMASIGRLAAIVAHEINNPLAGILTYSKLLLKKLQSSSLEDEKFKQGLEMIAGESARCGEIVKGLLQFARPAPPHFQKQDVNEVVRQSVRLLQHKMDLMNLETRFRFAEDAPPIVCDDQQIRQALVALLINACEAMRPEDGILKIETIYKPDRHILEIVIQDNGIGMDEETKQHIFEPFFTTKEAKGMGLGLAVVFGIVRKHSGSIRVESAPGRGSTFTIELPEEPVPEIPAPDTEERSVMIS